MENSPTHEGGRSIGQESEKEIVERIYSRESKQLSKLREGKNRIKLESRAKTGR